MTSYKRYRSEVLIALLGLAIAAALLPWRGNFPFDDTYITFRYAYNLAHGFGIVWNPGGPHTEGYTNFLYVLLLTPFSAMGWDLVAVSQAINVVAVIITAIALYRITNSLIAVALLYLDPYIWFNAYSGMETCLFTMFIVLAMCGACFSLRQGQAKVWPAFVFATLATLTRPEGAIMGALLLITAVVAHGGIRNSKFVLRNFFIWFVIPLVAYAIWKLWYFGNLLPNSFYVKVAQAHHLYIQPERSFFTSIWYIALLGGYGLGYRVWGMGYALRRKKRIESKNEEPNTKYTAASIPYTPSPIPLAALWCICICIFFLFVSPLMGLYDRFLNSVEVCLILLAAFALRSKPFARFALPTAVVVLALQVFWQFWMRGGLHYITYSIGKEYTGYQAVAEVFAQIPHHEEITVSSSDAGVMPYYAGIKHIDPVGLNTTSIAHAKTWQEVNAMIARARPDIIFIPLEATNDTTGCWRVSRNAHGLIGLGYPTLMQQPGMSTYKSLARMAAYNVDIEVDTASVHYADIRSAVLPKVGSVFAPPVKCLR